MQRGTGTVLAEKVRATGVRVQAVLLGATRTKIWERSGKDPDTLMPGKVMDVDDLVDAALVGLDKGETVTIPPLADEALWTTYNDTRLALAPHLSGREVAQRYRQSVEARTAAGRRSVTGGGRSADQ